MEPPDPELPTLSIADVSVAEGDADTTELRMQVTLSTVVDQDVTVDYTTVADSAAEGSDFTPTSGTLTFVPGVIRMDVVIDVIADTVHEEDETLMVDLSNPVNATLSDAQGLATITDDDPALGLLARPQNLTCLAPPRPTQDAEVDSEDAFPTAPSFSQMTKILQAPGQPSRWYILEKNGFVRVFDVADPTSVSTYLDISGEVWTDSEGGILGMAFAPDFPNTPEVYVSYTGFDGGTRVSKISRMILDDVVSPSNPTEEVLLMVNQDFNNHNGGEIEFGNDGYLYIGMGDGGSAGDPNNRAQNNRHMLGAFLRIDVDGVAHPSPGYNIPTDNPFAGNPKCSPGTNGQDCPEIYAWGIRNPWRWSFDRPTGTLWVGDVGQDAYEEVSIIENGGNYGWRCYEGRHEYNTAGCANGGFVEPVAEYPHALGFSITGGHVYRGAAIPELQGRYVFGDFGSGRIWALRDAGQGGFFNDELVNTPYNISDFALGEDGELYFADYGGGRIRRIIQGNGGGADDQVPMLLSETGCVDPGDIRQPYEGLIPYDINAPFWSDGAQKERYIGLPEGTTVDIDVNGDWDFPFGTVIVKHFRLAGDLIETRLFIRHPDGVWAGYTYEWNDTQTEANRVRGGKIKDIDGQDWIYPSEGQCMECHTAAAGYSLGPENQQFNRDFAYPQTGVTANQLFTLEQVGVFTDPLADIPENLPALPDPADQGAELASRARSYLHTNCAQCHQPGGPTPSSMDLRYVTILQATNACDEVPTSGDLGIVGARIIAPGDAGASVLVERMNRRDVHGMPRIGSSIADAEGVTLVSDWIESLGGCQ